MRSFVRCFLCVLLFVLIVCVLLDDFCLLVLLFVIVCLLFC